MPVIMAAIALRANDKGKHVIILTQTCYNNLDDFVMNTKQTRATGPNAVGVRRRAEAQSREA